MPTENRTFECRLEKAISSFDRIEAVTGAMTNYVADFDNETEDSQEVSIWHQPDDGICNNLNQFLNAYTPAPLMLLTLPQFFSNLIGHGSVRVIVTATTSEKWKYDGKWQMDVDVSKIMKGVIASTLAWYDAGFYTRVGVITLSGIFLENVILPTMSISLTHSIDQTSSGNIELGDWFEDNVLVEATSDTLNLHVGIRYGPNRQPVMRKPGPSMPPDSEFRRFTAVAAQGINEADFAVI